MNVFCLRVCMCVYSMFTRMSSTQTMKIVMSLLHPLFSLNDKKKMKTKNINKKHTNVSLIPFEREKKKFHFHFAYCCVFVYVYILYFMYARVYDSSYFITGLWRTYHFLFLNTLYSVMAQRRS